MNGQAQIAAVFLAGFFSQGQPAEPVSDSQVDTSRIRPEIVQISQPTCAMLTEHVPDDDVAYQPGVSVTGKPVAGADLNPAPYALRPVYQFDVEITPKGLSQKFNNTTGLPVATVTYEPETGKVMLDGQELVWLHENALLSACAKRNSNR